MPPFLLDDAHAFGVIGENGRGTASHFGLTDKVDLIMGTFSKSFGSLGGFIAGSSNVMNYISTMPEASFSAPACPRQMLRAVSKAIDIMLSEPERIENLWKLTRHAHEEFRKRASTLAHGISHNPALCTRHCKGPYGR